MITKVEISWEKHEHDSNHLLVFLSYHENPKGFERHFFFYSNYY